MGTLGFIRKMFYFCSDKVVIALPLLVLLGKKQRKHKKIAQPRVFSPFVLDPSLLKSLAIDFGRFRIRFLHSAIFQGAKNKISKPQKIYGSDNCDDKCHDRCDNFHTVNMGFANGFFNASNMNNSFNNEGASC